MKDIVAKLIEFENGEMEMAEKLAFFAELGNTGVINHLQGSYGHAFALLVQNEHLTWVDGSEAGKWEVKDSEAGKWVVTWEEE